MNDRERTLRWVADRMDVLAISAPKEVSYEQLYKGLRHEIAAEFGKEESFRLPHSIDWTKCPDDTRQHHAFLHENIDRLFESLTDQQQQIAELLDLLRRAHVHLGTKGKLTEEVDAALRKSGRLHA